MKYILNESPTKTTNNFKVNNVEVDLDICETDFNKYNISNTDSLDVVESINENFTSKIGLDCEKYYLLDITTKKDYDKIIYIDYDFSRENNFLTTVINLNIKYDSKFIIKYNGINSFLNLKLVTNIDSNVKCDISFVNTCDKTSTSLVAFENYLLDNSKLTINYFDLCGNKRISNYYTELNKDNSISNFNNIYIGSSEDLIDMNYYTRCCGKNTKCNMNVVGTLNDKSIKTFRGIIDFISGCSNSKGEELENCLLLSDDVKSKSLPVILCDEEDVEGVHGVSTGKFDSDKLFYLTSRGLSEDAAKKLIIKSNFSSIINTLEDTSFKEFINNLIDEVI